MSTGNQVPSLISKTLKITGEIESMGCVEVEGIIFGNIKTDILTIRESGIVQGDVLSRVINLKGDFKGNINSEYVNISKKARIDGIIKYKILTVENGAVINGKFERMEDSKKKEKN